MVPRRRLTVFVVLLAVIAVFSTVAFANVLNSGTGTATCMGWSISINASSLTAGITYTIDYTVTATCNGVATTVSNSISFTATDTMATETASGTWPGAPLVGTCDFKGSATLTNSGSFLPTI